MAEAGMQAPDIPATPPPTQPDAIQQAQKPAQQGQFVSVLFIKPKIIDIHGHNNDVAE